MLKKTLKVLLTIILVIIIFMFWAIRPVDHTHFSDTEYFKATKTRFDSLAGSLSASYGPVLIGFGKTSITPSLYAETDDPGSDRFVSVPLAGFGARRGATARGIHDSLFVKAVAVRVEDKTLVVIGSDMLIMPPGVSALADELIYQSTGLTRQNLFYSATHTHSSIGGWSKGVVGELFGGPFNPKVVDWLAKKIADAVIIAVDDIKPGRIGTGKFHAPDFVESRRRKEGGLVNDDFMIIRAEQLNGKKVILGSFDAHPTTLTEWNMEFSGDYPGYWQRRLESHGFDMAVFLAGSVANHSYKSQGDKFEISRYIGEALADSVIKYDNGIVMRDSAFVSALTLRIDYPEFQFRITDGLRINPFLAENLFPEIGIVYLQTLRLNDLVWATSPADFSGETAIIYKNSMKKKGLQAMVTSFNGAYTGYIIPDKYYHLDSYESRMMNWFGPGYNSFNIYMLGEMFGVMSSVK